MHPTILIHNFTPVLEYGLVAPDEEKHRWGFILIKIILINKQTENTFLTNPLSLYVINCKHNIQSYSVNKTKTVRWQNLFLSWTTTTMGGRSSLPIPGERSNSDSLGPPSLLWSAWLELGATIVKYQSLDSVSILNLTVSSPS